MMTKKIDRFWGEYRFLSNFWPSKIVFMGEKYPTVEHAYQAAKTIDPEKRRKIAEASTPGKAKRLGSKVELREDWDDIKFHVMGALLNEKFKIPELRQKLLDTDDAELIEGNTWGDTYWGVCNGEGENNLGKLLTMIRYWIRKGDL